MVQPNIGEPTAHPYTYVSCRSAYVLKTAIKLSFLQFYDKDPIETKVR